MFKLFGNSEEPKPTSPADYKIAPENQKLWDQLCAFVFDEPGAAYPFSARLAKRNSYRGGWSQEYAVRVLDEYRKFLFLLRTAGHVVTPSMAVDEAWHIHLIYTRSYWVDLCLKIFGVAVHHQPGNGNDEDTAMWAAVYERTLDDYTKVFGTPPVDIWGKPNPDIDWRAELAKHNFDKPRREDPTLSVFQK